MKICGFEHFWNWIELNFHICTTFVDSKEHIEIPNFFYKIVLKYFRLSYHSLDFRITSRSFYKTQIFVV